MDLKTYECWKENAQGMAHKVAYTGEFTHFEELRKKGKMLAWKYKKNLASATLLLVGDNPDEAFIDKVKGSSIRNEPVYVVEEAALEAHLNRPLPWFPEMMYAEAGGNQRMQACTGMDVEEFQQAALENWHLRSWQLVYGNVGEPATEEEIEAEEQRLGLTLDAALKDVYRQANGIILGARYSSKPDCTPPVHVQSEGVNARFFMEPHVDQATFWHLEESAATWIFGVLCIPPLSELETWEEFYGMEAPDKRYKNLVLLDACYAYSPAFVQCGPGKGHGKVWCASDHGADVYNTKMTVEAYLGKGSIEQRGGRRTWWRE